VKKSGEGGHGFFPKFDVKRLTILEPVKICVFERKKILIHIVNLILRIICFATLGNKVENKLKKADFS
jgi:hypothetical protein